MTIRQLVGDCRVTLSTLPEQSVQTVITSPVKASTRPGDVILDPFAGAGTVGLVADRLDRNAFLCELKDGYADMSSDRIVGDAPLFVELGP